MTGTSWRPTRRDTLTILCGAAAFGGVAGAAIAQESRRTVRPGDPLDAAVKEAIRAGEKGLRLLAGDHGPQKFMRIVGNGFEITGEPGARLGETAIRGCTGLRLRDVAFRGELSGSRQPALVQIGEDCRDVALERCSVASVEDAASWSDQDWVDRPYLYGLLARGQASRIAGCRFFNLRNCVALAGPNATLSDCDFDQFGNDAVNFRASGVRIVDNRIRGGRHTPLEKLHADGIQGVSGPGDGTFEDILIEGNQITFAGPGDYMQGISIFDGRWRNMRIVRNTVRVNVWNAIAAYGIDDLLVERNVVSSSDPKIRNWIEVRASKTGAPSTAVVVRDNVAPVFKINAPGATSVNNVSRS